MTNFPIWNSVNGESKQWTLKAYNYDEDCMNSANIQHMWSLTSMVNVRTKKNFPFTSGHSETNTVNYYVFIGNVQVLRVYASHRITPNNFITQKVLHLREFNRTMLFSSKYLNLTVWISFSNSETDSKLI